MDLSIILGLVLGVGGITLGYLVEGGRLTSLMHLAAALVVFGGTLGATIVANSIHDLKEGIRLFFWSLFDNSEERDVKIAQEILECAQIARKESILSIERRINTFTSAYMKNVFRFMLDGIPPETLRDVFEEEIEVESNRQLSAAKVWSDAGGYSPTIGIIGAVLGLIQVMGNLTNTAELGKGIAVAFVATIYGVGGANLVFLPIGARIRRRIEREVEVKQMVLEGAIAIVSGLNPYIIEEKMRSYVRFPAKAV